MINKYFIDGLDISIGILDSLKSINIEGNNVLYENNNELNNITWDKFMYFSKSLIHQKGGITNVLMNYKETIDGNDFSSHDREKHILGLVEISTLKQRDYKRNIHGTVPFANYVFRSILNLGEKNIIKLNVNYLDELNPFKQKYNNFELKTLEDKFEFLRDYINENSFALDAAAIGGMTGATDFVQLYKYVMMKEIIKIDDRKMIIEKLFEVLNSETIEKFITNYDEFIKLLKDKNTNDDKRLSRLYNRLYFIFSFILNNLKPEIFPIYFSATRNTLRTFGIEGYENVVKIYKEIIDDNDFKIYIEEYLNKVGIDEKNYSNIHITELSFKKDLSTNHAKYRFFQDLCWVINRNILDGQDYLNNLGKSKTFKYEELKNKIYPFEKDQDGNLIENDEKSEDKKITFGEIINIDYLISEGYITEISPGEYQVIKTDPYFIRDRKENKKTEETN